MSAVTELAQLDPKDLYVVESSALSTAAENVGEGLQLPENDTNSLQSLSHIEPPIDNVYMICGVLIVMALAGVIIILLAVTISKLRKRDDQHHNHHHNNHHTSTTAAVHPEQVIHQVSNVEQGGIVNQAMTDSTNNVDSCHRVININNNNNNNNHNNNHNNIMNNMNNMNNNGCEMINDTRMVINDVCNNNSTKNINNSNVDSTMTTTSEAFIWQFPPPYPPPNTPPPQYTMYNDQDTLVHGLQSDRQGFAKGIRKNLGGRWRRLVKRKPESETCGIPPELKDQLKTIYVY